MMPADTQIWLIIILLGIGTFLVRFSFLGLIGNRQLPDWVLRHLRYVSVAVMPGIVAPLVLWPEATNGELDPARLGAACAALLAGLVTRSVIWAVIAGGCTLYGLLYLLG
ncbi:AzlD domain-containing protein [Algirhabdus cladophorae]|uniref:AzlD domain-containing protein n=1 Tax=Algirhabdus cladophorae TaxID=3377108 RepID=UPI003B8489B9